MKKNIKPVKVQLQIVEEKFTVQSARLQKTKEIIESALEVDESANNLEESQLAAFYKDMLQMAMSVLETN